MISVPLAALFPITLRPVPDSNEAMGDLLSLSAFLDGRAWAHFWKEEDVLLPQLLEVLPEARCRIRSVLGGHNELRRANDRFQTSVASRSANGYAAEAIAAIRESGGGVIALLREHLPVEEEMLFAEAEARLSKARGTRLLDAFKVIDEDIAWSCEQLEGYSPSTTHSAWWAAAQ